LTSSRKNLGRKGFKLIERRWLSRKAIKTIRQGESLLK
jgi:hypothetical protein